MRSRKRPVSVDAGDEPQESSAKHVKLEEDRSGSPATITENASTQPSPEGIHGIAIPNDNSVIKQELVSNPNFDNTKKETVEDIIMRGTSNFQDTMDSLSRHMAYKDQKILELQAMINQPRNISQDNSHSVIHNTTNPSSDAATQADVPNSDMPESHSTELQDSHTRIQELEALVREQEATASKQEATIKEQAANNQEYESTIEELQQKWQQAETELEALKQQSSLKLASSEDIDDKTVLEAFQTLASRIKNITSVHFSGGPLYKSASSERRELFDRMAKNWGQEYLKEPARKQFFFEAVIWHRLLDKLLCCPLTIWSKSMGENLRQLHKTIWRKLEILLFRCDTANTLIVEKSEQLPIYHSMRLQVAEVFLQVHKRDGFYLGKKDTATTNRGKLVEELEELLGSYTYVIQRCQHDLKIIVDKAIELAYTMAMAKAHYAVRMSRVLYDVTLHGFNFKPVSMFNIVDPEYEAGVVDLVVSPTLVKFGTSEGEDYGRGVILKRSRVISEK